MTCQPGRSRSTCRARPFITTFLACTHSRSCLVGLRVATIVALRNNSSLSVRVWHYRSRRRAHGAARREEPGVLTVQPAPGQDGRWSGRSPQASGWAGPTATAARSPRPTANPSPIPGSCTSSWPNDPPSRSPATPGAALGDQAQPAAWPPPAAPGRIREGQEQRRLPDADRGRGRLRFRAGLHRPLLVTAEPTGRPRPGPSRPTAGNWRPGSTVPPPTGRRNWPG